MECIYCDKEYQSKDGRCPDCGLTQPTASEDKPKQETKVQPDQVKSCRNCYTVHSADLKSCPNCGVSSEVPKVTNAGVQPSSTASNVGKFVAIACGGTLLIFLIMAISIINSINNALHNI